MYYKYPPAYLTGGNLFEFADFIDKLVLDVGSCTGKLAVTAAEKARRVYDSEIVELTRVVKSGGYNID